MPESVLVALITGGFSAMVSVVATMVTNSKTTALMKYRLDQMEKKQDKHNEILDQLEKKQDKHNSMIDQLEKKQDKHNSMIERVYHLEENAQLVEEKIKVANRRIEDLEKRPNWDTTVKVRDINV